MAERVKISPKVVREQILDKGMTRVELAQHYGISTAQINKFLEVTNMKDLRPKKVMFEIDLEEENNENLVVLETAPIPTQVIEQENITSQSNTNFLY